MTLLPKTLIAVLSTVLLTQVEYGYYGLVSNLGLVLGLAVWAFVLGLMRWSDE